MIEGSFSPQGAAEVLFSIIGDKIRFHNVEILSIKERFNGDTQHSEKRLKELKAAKKQVAQLILEARDKGYQVDIHSTIEIELTKQFAEHRASDTATTDIS